MDDDLCELKAALGVAQISYWGKLWRYPRDGTFFGFTKPTVDVPQWGNHGFPGRL